MIPINEANCDAPGRDCRLRAEGKTATAASRNKSLNPPSDASNTFNIENLITTAFERVSIESQNRQLNTNPPPYKTQTLTQCVSQRRRLIHEIEV